MLGESSQHPSQICNTSHKSPNYNFCNHSHFSILYFNSRSLLPKIDELRALCLAYHPSVVCLTETWLCPDVQDNELLIPNYTIVRLDRNRHGGGVAMFIDNSLSIKVLLHGPMGLELIVVSLLSRNHPNCCVGVFYRPPSSQLHIFNSLFDTLFSIRSAHFSNFVLVGDFNVNFLNTDHHLFSKVRELMDSFALSQVVNSPTHNTSSSHPSLIDLVFVSNMNCFCQCHVIPQLANSDHHGLIVHMKDSHQRTTFNHSTRRKVWQYKHADFDRANDLLMDLDLDNIINPSDMDSSWLSWKQEFLRVMDECIPSSTLPDRKNLPWLTKEIIQLIRKRNFYFKKAQKNNPNALQKFKLLRNKVVTKLRANKQKFLAEINPRHPKDFWKMIKVLNPSSSFPTLATDNSTATDNVEKANLLNSTFISHFNNKQPPLTSADLPLTDPNGTVDNILCSEDQVYELLTSIDTTTANGHDDISAIMLKKTALSITPAVTKLFNVSLTSGELPSEWKTARVTPIPKSGDSSNPSNYRPISLLSILSKLLEKHIVNLLTEHLKSHAPLSQQQWGFTKGKSSTGALLAALDNWHRSLEAGNDICAVFFDYRKAFDSVPHRLLLRKLRDLKVNFYILKWITVYLTNRKQYVCVDGSSSDVLPVSSGVPQGSVIGPILFIIYIDGITKVALTAGNLSLYADDILLYRRIQNIEDFAFLQNDVTKLCSWTNDNLLDFNAIKCKYMLISKRREPILPVVLTVNSSPLERVDAYKYLGVWITSDLTWSKQVTEVCKKARQKIGILYRKYYQHATPSTMLQLYLSCIRPDLEYAVPAWDPHLQCLINSLEAVQKFAMRVCTKQWSSNYNAVLNAYGVPSLRKRRLILKLSYLYNILNGRYSLPEPSSVETRTTSHFTRSHRHTLIVPRAHTNSYFYSFFCDTPRTWNTLPSHVVESSNVDIFKRNLTNYLIN